MKIKYYLQKLLGIILNSPIIPKGRTVGYSLVKSERYDCHTGVHTRITPPFFLHQVELGDYSYIAKNSNVSNCYIGKFCSIGPNFCCGLGIHPIKGISTSPMFYSTAKQNGMTLCEKNKTQETKQTIIGNDVFIGANVTVLDGVHIADGAVIGAGAVVTRDVPPYAIVIGVPAKIVKYRFEEEIIKALLKKRWWDAGKEEWKRLESLFWSVQEFISE
jgi:acetyltransferase-like isoleucine patch superfamily enzyme